VCTSEGLLFLSICGRSYIGEKSRHIKEHKQNSMQGLLEKSKLAQYSYKEGHKICWSGGKVLQTEWKSS
jgi:hypothetical protein